MVFDEISNIYADGWQWKLVDPEVGPSARVRRAGVGLGCAQKCHRGGARDGPRFSVSSAVPVDQDVRQRSWEWL